MIVIGDVMTDVIVIPEGLLVETMRRLPGRDPGDGFYAAVIKSE